MRSTLCCLVLLAAGCGNHADIHTPDELETAYIDAYCQREVRCAGWPASEMAGCIAYAQKEGVLVAALNAAHAGKMTFDAAQASACIDALNAAGCNFYDFYSPSCNGVFKPAVPVGGACDTLNECVGGECNLTSMTPCAGTCAAYVATGAPCGSAMPCAKTDFCDSTTSTCKTLPALGASCDGVCSGTLNYCKGWMPGANGQPDTLGTCAAFGGPGQSCEVLFLGWSCTPGLYCDENQTCQPTLSVGSSCKSGAACQPGNYCRGLVIDFNNMVTQPGTCAAISDVGGACTPGTDPLGFSGCPGRLTCTMASVCAYDTPEGAMCGSQTYCSRDDDYCDENGVCSARVGLGQPCTPAVKGDDPCATSMCDPMMHVCTSGSCI